jgi:phasin
MVKSSNAGKFRQEATMAKDSAANFEMPPQMREFAEKSVEQAKQAFDSFVAAAQHAVKTAENQAATTQSGVKEVGTLAMRYAERNIASSFEFAQRLLRAKDPKEIMALHGQYVSGQIATLTEQAKELGKQATKMTG